MRLLPGVQFDEATAHERMTAAFSSLSDVIRSYGRTVLEVRGDDIAPTVRVGIALGEVVIADGTATGPGIVLAQRTEQLATADGICVTGAVREAAPGRLPFEYEDLGPNALKGFEDPVNVYAARRSGSAELPSPERRQGVVSRTAPTPKSAWLTWTALGCLIVMVAVAAACEELAYLLERNPKFSLEAAARWPPTYIPEQAVNDITEVLRSVGLPAS